MDEIKNLLASDNDWVKQKAQLAVSFTEQYRNGEMDRSEYEELMQDLIRTDEVMANASSMEVKAKLEKAITLLMTVV